MLYVSSLTISLVYGLTTNEIFISAKTVFSTTKVWKLSVGCVILIPVFITYFTEIGIM